MKIAILKCDEVLTELQSEFGDYDDMIRRMFDVIDNIFEFDVFDVRQSQYPSDINVYDFFITTGSKVGVYEDIAWIHKFVEFVRLLIRQKIKLIGICFGHQVISEAFYSGVEKTDRGWGIGVSVNRLVAKPDWMTSGTEENKSELNIIVSHQDQIIELPDEALVIAESDFCPYFLVQWNSHILSIQGHPEFNIAYSAAMMNRRKAIIPAQRIKEGLDSLKIEPDNRLFANWIMEFVKQ